MRMCTKCKVEKGLEDFYQTKKRKDGIYPWCKQCSRAAGNAFYRKNPEPYRKRARAFNTKRGHERIAFANEIKKCNGCQICGEKTVCVLDFHHVVGGNSKGKDGGMPVTRAAWQSNKKFQSELAKCVVLCANCHRKVHAGLETVNLAVNPQIPCQTDIK